ncbi:ABC transporter ATP-binding protein [Dongia deserti]|uniref:ABC transporter ATP-binding protein n=1 Tax=Dongia deserti TaxID=2268030 RepID=UPI000E65984F|nr:ABC transporter ATP-binding protein [Dongia deserti]
MTGQAETTKATGTTVPLLSLTGIVKQFPGCLANDRVDLTVLPGEIHALLGENGAGKSTLVKIIYGVLKPDAGEIRWQGEPIVVQNPNHARRLGIGMVFQHFSLFETLTVAENIALGLTDAADRKGLRTRIAEISRSYGLHLDPDKAVHDLSVGERQRIEIVRCLLQKPKLLIMDEPTSVLTPQEVERLFETLRRLAKEGCAILYISHKLEEIRALCERATIMRLGKVVAHCDPRQETAKRLAEMMIGTALKAASHQARGEANGGPRLEVKTLNLKSEQQFGTDLKNVSLAVKGGEILGIGGIAGNGQAELMAALSGEMLAASPNAIVIDGTHAGKLGPRERRALGGCFVPEERNGHGAVSGMSLSENAFLSGHIRRALARNGLIDSGKTAGFADDVIKSFDVRTTGPSAEARSLSGGNLQKFLVGREVKQSPSVLVVSQPTWGVDAGAAAAIHQALMDLADSGTAVVVISQDLDEIFALADRIAVIAEGKLSQAIPIGEASVEQIGLLMGGMHGTSGGRDVASA